MSNFTSLSAYLIENKKQNQCLASSSCSIAFIKVVSETLLAVIEECKRLPLYSDLAQEQKSLPFYFQVPPLISVCKYIIRIVHNTNISQSTLIIALIYLDRLFREHNVIIDEYTVHRLIIGSILLALKYNEDLVYTQSYYARVAGVLKKEIILIETQILKTMDYKLYVDNGAYETYKNYFELFLLQTKKNSFFMSKELLCL